MGIQFEADLLWSASTSVTIKKAQQRLYFLRLLRKNLSQKLLVILPLLNRECVDILHVCVWYVSCTAAERKALQSVINTAKKIIGCSPPQMNCTVQGALKKLKTSSGTHHTPDINSLNCCPLAEDTGQ